jgi:hypothetical protein
LEAGRAVRLLRGNDAAEGMAPREDDPAMIDLWCETAFFGKFCKSPAVSQRSSTGRAPVRNGFLVKHGVAMSTNPFHM